MRLGLGTVQFGLNYGVSNKDGQPDAETVRNILGLAKRWGVNLLDTAYLYGSSEQVIGENNDLTSHFDIVTKTDKLLEGAVRNSGIEVLDKHFHESLERLKRSKVNGLLLHSADDVLKPGGELVVDFFARLKYEQYVGKVGVSVYSPEQLSSVLQHFTPDIVQLPLNVFDQRMLNSGMLSALKSKGIEVHVRSVFLQGLLLMGTNEIPNYFNPILRHIKSYHAALRAQQLSLIEGALGFIKNLHDLVDVIVIGANQPDELAQICSVWFEKNDSQINYSEFALSEERFIDPSNWVR